MDPEESIETMRSEDNGNVPIDTPLEPTEPVIPAETVEEPVIEPELYELPDGRKVDAVTLSREWKENFYPDYTRKAQALAARETPTEPTIPTLNDEWVPKSYAEIVQTAKESIKADLQAEQQAQTQRQQEIETKVANELVAIKTSDPTVNENALFLHANKYGFNNLQSAYQNMKDMSQMAKNIQQATAQNVTRRNDPVSISTGNTGGNLPDASQFSSASEYLQSLQ